jgi:MoaA/NifB/PqqE/SkfB family radical SAM enzyme
MSFVPLKRKIRAFSWQLRQVKVVAKAMHSRYHPIVAHVIPVRRCNLACTYCNEFDKASQPVPTDVMLRRIDRLHELGTTIITFSGGEPLLHPDLDDLIRRIRGHGLIATLITNGYLLTPDRIQRLNRAELDSLQISIDNVLPDEVSKKSLKVLDKKLQWLAQYAEFNVNINSVVGSSIQNPEDAVVITRRAAELGFQTTIGIIHDGGGQLVALDDQQQRVYHDLVNISSKSFSSFAYYQQFQKNLVSGNPNNWHCRAGNRYLYICEDGLVHYCSQQRGSPAIPLEKYEVADLQREHASVKSCAPFCTISCVHQASMVDQFLDSPSQALGSFFPPRSGESGPYHLPTPLRPLLWLLLPRPGSRRERVAHTMRQVTLRLLGVK